jgi:hypothetical protein
MAIRNKWYDQVDTAFTRLDQFGRCLVIEGVVKDDPVQPGKSV